ncbi:MAG: HTH domain-containing protein [Epulopiscium sp.]|nr:HTH domain-containing protein [Candidatus Epulonipiscium sp.]
MKSKEIWYKKWHSNRRPERTLPKEFKKYYDKWNEKEIKATEFAKLIGVSRATLYRYISLFKSRK